MEKGEKLMNIICEKCNKEISNKDKYCPFCGEKNAMYEDQNIYQKQSTDKVNNTQNQTYVHSEQNTPISGIAIASLVLGILSLFISWFTFFIPAILGIVFGCIGLNQCKQGKSGRGMAIGGLVTSIVSIVILIITFLLVMVLGMASLSWYYAF